MLVQRRVAPLLLLKLCMSLLLYESAHDGQWGRDTFQNGCFWVMILANHQTDLETRNLAVTRNSTALNPTQKQDQLADPKGIWYKMFASASCTMP